MLNAKSCVRKFHTQLLHQFVLLSDVLIDNILQVFLLTTPHRRFAIGDCKVTKIFKRQLTPFKFLSFSCIE